MDLHLQVPGRYDRLGQIAEFVEQAGAQAGLDEAALCRCQLAVDEACTNIIEHGYGGEGRGDIDLACTGGDGELIIMIEDEARPFDPAAVPHPRLSADLDEVSIGGLGLYFMRQVMDAVEFSYAGGRNRLVLVKRREALPAAGGPAAC